MMHQRRVIREFVPHCGRGQAGSTMRLKPSGIACFASREAPANVESILADGPMANVYSRRDHIKPEDYPKPAALTAA
jgi:hypothetical protein